MKTLTTIHQLLIVSIILAFISPAYCKDQTQMDLALDYLKKAAAPESQPSMLNPPEPVDRVGLLKSAQEALNKAPSIYKGRKAQALEYVKVALDLFKDHQQAKAISYINKAISEVREGIRVAD
jgi:hypothetical protein